METTANELNGLDKKSVDYLIEAGLNKYEAKVYLTLIAEGVSTAKNISDITGIPYGKVYEIINSLCTKGFSIILPTKPMKCQAVSPQEAIKTLKKKTEERFQELEKTVIDELNPMYTKTKEFVEPKGLFWVINGRANINKKIEKLIEDAGKHINIFISENGLKRLVIHKEKLEEAHKKGVKIHVSGIVTKDNLEDVNSLGFCDIKHNKKVTKNHLFSNGKESVIVEAIPDDDDIIHGRDRGILITSENFTLFLEDFFIPCFNRAEILDKRLKKIN